MLAGYVVDHLGIQYKTVARLCNHYGIDVDKFVYRLINGMNLTDTLTKRDGIVGIRDSQGRKFKNVNEMCKFYGISYVALSQNLLEGKSLALSLRTRPTFERKKPVNEEYIHGFEYFIRALPNICKSNGNSVEMVIARLADEWELAEAVKTPISVKVYDHKGKRYATMQEMAKAYCKGTNSHLGAVQLTDMLVRGNRTIADSLLILSKGSTNYKDTPEYIRDHNGNFWETIDRMCRNYKVPTEKVKSLLDTGYSVGDAIRISRAELRKARPEKKEEKIVDHKGNVYNSITELAEQYGLRSDTLRGRIRRGWDLERALTTPVQRK